MTRPGGADAQRLQFGGFSDPVTGAARPAPGWTALRHLPYTRRVFHRSASPEPGRARLMKPRRRARTPRSFKWHHQHLWRG